MKASATLIACLAVISLTAVTARAETIVNFDALNASGRPQGMHGQELSNYLATYGVSISGATPGTYVTVYDARDIYADIQPVIPTSPFNVITQGGSNDPVSYTLDFTLAQDFFSFTRTGVRAGRTGVALPAWRVTAYDAANNLIGSVEEGARSIFVDIPEQTFTLNGPNIRHITVASNNGHVAAFSSAILDNFRLSAVPNSVPEPGTIALVVGIASVGGMMLKRRRKR